MPKLLVIDSSPRGPASVSRTMTDRFVADWKAAHPDGEVRRRDLTYTGLEFVTGPWLKAYFTPPPEQTDADKAALALSDTLAQEVLDADEIAISTPVYNYNVPAILKAWIDHIVRKGMTLGMNGMGLVTDTKATVLIASGGVYTEGSPIAHRDIAPQYLRVVLEAIGITDVTIIAGGGAKAVDMGEATMDGFVDTLAADIKAAAA
ncbi:FMN-dependent NADH-azoreductase [Cognatiyoonia sp. IB215182]|uniref:FMN-dependent NADH-azoreductase n=1 Tax=Cognatiyoonia sp. IB215182 TaxID=3097353 RepID=UPI002A0FE547|nr:NAD(P)H-dependent oxidoreductase [Cognatiyoonia sp. IB215182]MDX8355618.1 NAD(P)H-dependent oxidoreductase [Cognatiyoonia sp. IB215182]